MNYREKRKLERIEREIKKDRIADEIRAGMNWAEQ